MNADEINKILEKWMSSAEGKRVISTARAKAKKEGHMFGHLMKVGGGGAGGGTGAGSSPAEDLFNKIIQEITDVVRTQFPKMPSDPNQMFRIYQKIDEKTGDMQYSLFFIPWIVHRTSLYPEGYPDGLENIVALRSHGSGPSKKAVWNKAAFEWDYRSRPGKPRVYPRQHGEYREGQHYFIPDGMINVPNPFLIHCIDQLNEKYKNENVRVALNPKYYPD